MPKHINLKGTAGETYNLEELKTSNTRTDSSKDLIVQIWYWNPNGILSYKDDLTKYEEHKLPNPPRPKLGQIWISRWVKEDFKEE